MKMVIGLLALSFAASSFASTGETKTFIYDGSQDSVELLLRGEKTHTEYRVEDVNTTCSRQELSGYTQFCTGGGFGGGYGPGYGYPFPHRPFPGTYYPGHYPGPGYGYRHCVQQPTYRTVYYPCVQTVRTPYEVKDFDVDTKVVLNVTNASEITANEKFVVTLNGDQLTLTMNGSKKLIGLVKSENINPQMAGSVKVIDAVYNVELVEAAPVVRAVKLTNISMSRGTLTVKAGPGANRSDLGLNLNVIRKTGADSTIFNRALSNSEFSTTETSGATNLVVNFPALGMNLKGKYSIKADFSFKGKVLNRAELPELSSTRTLIYKN